MSNRIIRAALALLALLPLAVPAAAYWEYGHSVVADVALSQVRPATRARIAALLRQSALLGTPECAATTLAEASYWPDCIKPLKGPDGKRRFGYAYNWHFQNVDVCAPFDSTAACKDGDCVSAQITRQAARLGDRALPAADRVQALAFLTHFAGDLAQPLHAGDRGDKGGNEVRARYGLIAGRANLHSVWDGYLPERIVSSPPAGFAGLLRGTTRAERRAIASASVEQWSRESWQASRDAAYGLLGDPCRALAPGERVVIDEAAIERLAPIVRRQMLAGGLRLARLLDEALGAKRGR